MFAHILVLCSVYILLHMCVHMFVQDMKSVPVGQEGALVLVATLSHVIAMVGQGSGREMLAPYRKPAGLGRRGDQGVGTWRSLGPWDGLLD